MHVISIPAGEQSYVTRWWSAMAMNSVALIIALWVVLAYQHNRSPLDMALIPALAGIAVLPAVAWKRFRLIDYGDAEKPSLATGFYALLLSIGVHAIEDQTLLDRSAGLWAGVMVGLILSALILWFERPVKAFWAFVTIAVLIFAAWGMAQIVNCLLDNSPEVAVQTGIDSRYATEPFCTHGGRYSSGSCVGKFAKYAVLSPLPYGLPAQLSVDSGWYRRAQIGDRVCITVHSGRLRARWYSFDLCPRA
ncbi:hypothetical protein [Asticcacaulis sp.]|uniref:hypothetical protein n=1 Tax=Asticcacaulis sp. TaxID=1872648 RepID=UPI003F7B3752